MEHRDLRRDKREKDAARARTRNTPDYKYVIISRGLVYTNAFVIKERQLLITAPSPTSMLF